MTDIKLVDPATLVPERATFDHFIGAGAMQWEWYGRPRYHGVPDQSLDQPDSAYVGWAVDFVQTDDDGPGEARRLDHASIMRAVWQLAWAADPGVRHATVINCRLLLATDGEDVPDEVDFDADTADTVMQVAAFGEVIYC